MVSVVRVTPHPITFIRFIHVDEKKKRTQVTPGPGGTRDVRNALTMKLALIP